MLSKCDRPRTTSRSNVFCHVCLRERANNLLILVTWVLLSSLAGLAFRFVIFLFSSDAVDETQSLVHLVFLSVCFSVWMYFLRMPHCVWKMPYHLHLSRADITGMHWHAWPSGAFRRKNSSILILNLIVDFSLVAYGFLLWFWSWFLL